MSASTPGEQVEGVGSANTAPKSARHLGVPLG